MKHVWKITPFYFWGPDWFAWTCEVCGFHSQFQSDNPAEEEKFVTPFGADCARYVAERVHNE